MKTVSTKNFIYLLMVTLDEAGSVITENTILYEATNGKNYLFDSEEDLLLYAQINDFEELPALQMHYGKDEQDANGRTQSWSDFSIIFLKGKCSDWIDYQFCYADLDYSGTNTGTITDIGAICYSPRSIEFGVPDSGGQIVVEVRSAYYGLPSACGIHRRTKTITSDYCWDTLYGSPVNCTVTPFTKYIKWTLYR
jgi:hypothetical protein